MQSALCARLLLRLRGAYNQISDATTISISTFTGKLGGARHPVSFDSSAVFTHQSVDELNTTVTPDSFIAMENMSSNRDAWEWLCDFCHDLKYLYLVLAIRVGSSYVFTWLIEVSGYIWMWSLCSRVMNSLFWYTDEWGSSLKSSIRCILYVWPHCLDYANLAKRAISREARIYRHPLRCALLFSIELLSHQLPPLEFITLLEPIDHLLCTCTCTCTPLCHIFLTDAHVSFCTEGALICSTLVSWSSWKSHALKQKSGSIDIDMFKL